MLHPQRLVRQQAVDRLNLNIVNPFFYFFRFPTNSPDGELAKLLWLVHLRWVAISLFFVLSAPALMTGLLTRETVPMFLGVLGILIVFNLVTQMTITDQKRSIGPLLICFQMAFDLAMLTVLLSLTGGFSNPFVLLILINAMLGGFLISSRLSWPFLMLSHISLGFLQFRFVLEQPASVEPRLLATFGVYHVMVLSCWIVARLLGSHLERQFERETQARMLLEKQDRLRAIGALAAGFSHEFASPLNSAKIRLERILRKEQTEDALEALAAVQTCEAVVHQMNSSQLDRRDFQFKTVVVKDLLSDVVETWREDHPDIKIHTILEDSSETSLPPINFAQVILNLLDNAVEAAPLKDISVTLQSSETEFRIQILDQGPGIPESVIRRLGEPFVTTKPNGTGLGLYVSQLFCQSLGGALNIGNLDRGASITLVWPKGGV